MMDSKQFGQIALGLLQEAQFPGSMLDMMLQFRAHAEALARGNAVVTEAPEPPADA